MKRLRIKLNNMNLKTKLVLVIVNICFVPIILIYSIWYYDVIHSAVEKQKDIIVQNYELVYNNLSSEMKRMEQISFMLVVEENLNQALKMDENTTSVVEQLKKFDETTKYTAVLKESGNISDIVYYTDKEFVVTGYGATYRSLDRVRDTSWYQKYQERGKNLMWTAYTDRQKPKQSRYLTLCRGIWDFEDLSKRLGIVLISIDLDRVEQMFSNEEQFLFLVDQGNDVLIKNNEIELDLSLFRKRTDGFTENVVDDQHYLYCARRLPGTDVTLLSIVPLEKLHNLASITEQNMIVVGFVLLFVLFIVIYGVSESITKRIKILAEKLRKVSDGKFEIIDMGNSDDEVGKLIKSYNYLVGQIQNLLEKERRIGQEKKEAELCALQAQINPHFLYNTLDMIGWMSVRNENDNIQNTIQALARYYKLVLNRGMDVITLKEELEMCSVYMDIQLRRFKGKIQYKEDIQPEALDAVLPKITIQPFIENAIIHGINEKRDGRGTINVKVTLNEERLNIQISDDGVGFNSNKVKKTTPGNKYGMLNIEMRLNIFFGQEKSISIESVPGFGTDIYIDIPYVRKTSI